MALPCQQVHPSPEVWHQWASINIDPVSVEMLFLAFFIAIVLCFINRESLIFILLLSK